ncbi:MAG: DNRLRE domain-containing protein [candidate division Zixibacteria bacterium]|nr:DNRLRE domain-containing protein [candidate division Zixibacteria bacterium]
MLKKHLILMPIFVLVILLVFSCQDQPFGLRSDSQSTSPALQTIVIPTGATLVSATLYVYADQAWGHTINVHRITAEWDELTVSWGSFGGAFDATVENSFVTPARGWYSVDVTDLVYDWIMGTYENFGLLLDQSVFATPATRYRAKENLALEPYIEVCYIYEGNTECQTDMVLQDAFIRESWPWSRYGTWPVLFTGWAWDTQMEKQALLQFDFVYEPGNGGCTRTIGYWKTHAGFGPQQDMVTQYLPIWLGTAGETKSIEVTTAAIALDILEMKTYGSNENMITKLYAQLLGTKLNFANGASNEALGTLVGDADMFLAEHDWTDWESLSEEDQEMVEYLKDMLDEYNNGDIGPGNCDDYESMD